MIHRVADEVHQRVPELLHYRFIEFSIAAANHQHDVFAQVTAHVAYHPLKALEGRANLYHAETHGIVTHLFDKACQRRCRFQNLAEPGALR